MKLTIRKKDDGFHFMGCGLIVDEEAMPDDLEGIPVKKRGEQVGEVVSTETSDNGDIIAEVKLG